MSDKDIDPVDKFLAYTGAALALIVIITVVIGTVVAVIIVNLRG